MSDKYKDKNGVEGTVVEAVGVASSVSGVGKNPMEIKRHAFLEAAMADEINRCYSEGVVHPVAVKERMMAAREKAKLEYAWMVANPGKEYPGEGKEAEAKAS